MHVTVNIYANLRRYMPAGDELFKEKEWSMPDGSTVRHVIEKLKLPGEIQVFALLNNNHTAQTAVLKEGDIIHIMPLMAGG